MESTIEASFAEAVGHLDGGDARAAANALRRAAGYPQDLGSAENWVRLAGLLARLAEEAAPDLRRHALLLEQDPENLQHLYDTAYQLFEVGLFEIAAALLVRAETLQPGVPAILSELVSALEEMGLYGHAVTFLQRHPQLAQEQFLFAYLLAFNGILSGQPELAGGVSGQLAQASDEREQFMAARIARFLARVAHISPHTALDGQDLRGWHYVLTGGALLHLSAAGFDEPMRGRYAFVQDSMSSCRAAIDLVGSLLSTMQLSPPQVLLLPERGSEALGRATASVLNLPTAPFVEDAPGLVVAYDLDHLPRGAQMALRTHRPNQILWSHAVCWTDPPIVAPDVATMLYQFNNAPWQPQITATSEGESERRAEVEGTAEAIAAAVVAATPALDEARPDQRAPLWAAMREATGLARAAPMMKDGLRERMWYMGPVVSNRF